MDSIELARQVAADLHDLAIARGLDPWQPYDLAVGEANHRDVDVEATQKGAALLNNGRATFIPQDRLILHENIGPPFEQAVLVAHEIGHVELGDDHDATAAHDIDPARPAEPSPIGIDRVVDYSRRQKREVQMDLFAREFLLPRSVVRKLHLKDGLTASAIAERLGAPFDFVAQQLLDALLLPTVATTTDVEKSKYPPNPLQEAAANHRGKAFLLEAGPGTGKTHTLTARVDGLLSDGVDPRRILLLTFSNKAAGEMAERIALDHKQASAAMWIGTFHAFGLDLIRRFSTELGLPEDPRMMDRTEAAELLEEEFPRLNLSHYRNLHDPTHIIADILAAISRAKDEVIDENEYGELARSMLEKAQSAEEVEAAERAIEVARVYEAYETLKKKEACVDFGDLVSLPVRLLEGDSTIREHFRSKYDHVLVDEYQDVNRSSVRLLAALCGDGENLWVVGDAKQSIYRFRGASSFNTARFGREDFPGAERGRLRLNYRSVTEVVDAFSAFAIGMKVGDDESGLEAARDRMGKLPELRTVDGAEEQSVAIADAIGEMCQAGYGYRDQAVLCTGNEKLSKLGQELERLGVPVLFLGSLFERPEVKDLLALLTVLTDRRAMGLVRVAARWEEFRMPIDDVATVLDQLRAEKSPSSGWWQNPDSISNLSKDGQESLNKLAAAMSGFDHRASPWTVLATVLLDRTHAAARIAASSDVAGRSCGIAIWQLMNFIRVQPPGRGLPIVRLLNRIRRLMRLGDDRDLRQLPSAAQGIDAVRLMTIHGAKGLEFSVVHLPGLNTGTIPRTPPAPRCPPPDGMVEGGEGTSLEIFRAGQIAEQECLFYVALSRAKDRLIIFAPTRKANGHKWSLSPFLDRLGPRMLRRHITPSRSLPGAPEGADIALLIDGELTFSSSQISLYGSCARRFFYTHILQIGGRREATAYMLMHEAVRTVLRTIIDGEVQSASNEQPDLERQIDDAFSAHNLVEHGYVDDYKVIALDMANYYLSARNAYTPEPIAEVSLSFDGGHITVRPDDMLTKEAEGSRTLRRVRTGHYRSSESDDVVAAALMLAARQEYSNAVAELVHLADQESRPLGLSDRVLQNRGKKLNDFLQYIRMGRFPTAPSTRICPNCPAFFICGPTPSGTLEKKFE